MHASSIVRGVEVIIGIAETAAIEMLGRYGMAECFAGSSDQRHSSAKFNFPNCTHIRYGRKGPWHSPVMSL